MSGLSRQDSTSVVASHELIEAATDPFPFEQPGISFGEDSTTAWIAMGGENADLCFDQYWHDDTHYATRVWSNLAASLGADPCVPWQGDRPYFNVSSSPDEIRVVSPGERVEWTLSGWSTGPVADWDLEVVARGDLGLDGVLDGTAMNNGRTITLHAQIPIGAAPGTSMAYRIYSRRSGTDDFPRVASDASRALIAAEPRRMRSNGSSECARPSSSWSP